MGHMRSRKNTAFPSLVAISHTYSTPPRILSRVSDITAVHIWIFHTYLNNTPAKAEYIYLKVMGPWWTLCWAKDGWQKRTYVDPMSVQKSTSHPELHGTVGWCHQGTLGPWLSRHPLLGEKKSLDFTELSTQSKTRENVLGQHYLNA